MRPRISADLAGLRGDHRDTAVLTIKTEERTAEPKIVRAVVGLDTHP